MNAKELEKLIRANGWYLIKQVGSHRQYKYPFKKGKITIPFHGHKDLDVKTAESVLKFANLK